jgi:hypothetical protein
VRLVCVSNFYLPTPCFFLIPQVLVVSNHF